MSTMHTQDSRRPLRRDAAVRRESLISAARQEFAARGVDASLEKIARDAGVSIGTLYRHFPARIDLLVAAFAPRATEFLQDGEKIISGPDAWNSFVGYLEALFAAQAGDRGFNDFLSRRFPDNPATELLHDQLCKQIDDVLERGQSEGSVRTDLTRADIVNLIWANDRLIEATSPTALQTWRRQLHLMLDGYRAQNAHELPEPPMTDHELYDAMVYLGQRD